jgi:hypothetical protein
MIGASTASSYSMKKIVGILPLRQNGFFYLFPTNFSENGSDSVQAARTDDNSASAAFQPRVQNGETSEPGKTDSGA